jgi:hypothetical protein
MPTHGSHWPVDERRFIAGFGDRLQETVDNGGIGHRTAERKMIEGYACSLCGRGFSFHIVALLAGQPEIEDGFESHLLDLRDSSRRRRAGAGNCGLQP